MAPLLGMPWTIYMLLSGERRTIAIWVLLAVLIAVLAAGMTGLIRFKQRRP